MSAINSPHHIRTILAELGHDTRFEIFQLLLRLNDRGLSVGEIARRLDIAASTLHFHLQRLKGVGLIDQVTQGREVRCFASLPTLQQAISELEALCCADQHDREPI